MTENIKKFYDKVENDIGILNSRNALTMIFTSIGCHFLNLYQKDNPIIKKGGKPVDMRKHLMFVRIPGTGKSTLLNFLYDILPLSMKKMGQVRYENFITEAGFAGTVREYSGRIKEIPGLAKTCDKGFVIVEEFSSILESFNMSHSSSFEQTLLLALDSGKIIKTLATGNLEYETNLTFCCGIQPIKMASTSSGLLRRFLVEFYIPNTQTMDKIRKRARESWKQLKSTAAQSTLEYIREYVEQITSENVILDYQIDESVFDFFDEMKIPVAIETDIYMQSLFGYNYFKGNIEEGTLVVELDDFAKNMINVDYESRKLIAFDMQSLIVLMIIKEMLDNGYHPTNISISDIFLNSSCYQISFEEIVKAVDRLTKIGVLIRRQNMDSYQLVHKAFLDEIIKSVETVQGLVENK